MGKKPINEGVTRGMIKDGVSKPQPAESVRPSSPPPAPKSTENKKSGK
jgi:hypothetical protein